MACKFMIGLKYSEDVLFDQLLVLCECVCLLYIVKILHVVNQLVDDRTLLCVGRTCIRNTKLYDSKFGCVLSKFLKNYRWCASCCFRLMNCTLPNYLWTNQRNAGNFSLSILWESDRFHFWIPAPIGIRLFCDTSVHAYFLRMNLKFCCMGLVFDCLVFFKGLKFSQLLLLWFQLVVEWNGLHTVS